MDENGRKTGPGSPPVEHQFKPGNPGGGRPKGAVSITSRIQKYLRENPEKADQLAASMVEDAIKGNGTVLKELLSRVDGSVPQRIDVAQLTNEQVLSALELARQQEEDPDED
jgi:hypothetical protein